VRLALLGVLLALSACSRCMPVAVPRYGPPEPEPGIHEWYDASSGATQHTLTLEVAPPASVTDVDGRWVEVGFSQPGRAARTRPARVWLSMEDRAESDWSERTRVALVLDGRRIPVKGVQYAARGTKVGSIQSLTAEVDVTLMDQVGRAHAAAVEVGGVAHALEPPQQALLREFVATP
jgi:hypothetical protein